MVELEKQLDAAKTEADALQQRIESVRREAEAQLKEATTRMEAELHSRDEKLVRLKEQHQTAVRAGFSFYIAPHSLKKKAPAQEAEGRNRQEAELERQLARARADELVKRSTESTQQCDAEASSKEEALRAELQKRQEEIERLQAELRSTNEELKLVKAMVQLPPAVKMLVN